MNRSPLFLFFFLVITILCSLTLQATELQDPEAPILELLNLLPTTTVIDLEESCVEYSNVASTLATNSNHLSLPFATQDGSHLLITTSFFSSLLNILGSEGYDTLFHASIEKLGIACTRNKEGLQHYSAQGETILVKKMSLPSGPLQHVLEEKKNTLGQEKKYLVLRLGTTRQLPQELTQPCDGVRDENIATADASRQVKKLDDGYCWPAKSEKLTQLEGEYYWFQQRENDTFKSSSSAPLGELWMLLSAVNAEKATSNLHESTVLPTRYSSTSQTRETVPPLQTSAPIISTSNTPPTSSILSSQNGCTPDQQEAAIKTGIFLGACVALYFFAPELSLIEQATLAICSQCSYELVKSTITLWDMFFRAS